MSDRLEKLHRFTAMSFAEVRSRLLDHSRCEFERFGLHRPPSAPNEFKQYLADGPASRFYPGIRASVRDLLGAEHPEWIDAAVSDAESLCRHEFDLLSIPPVRLGDEIDWHRDPISAKLWERTFYADYRPENDPHGRDSKVIHELNRHQHLPRLAKAYFLTGDERFAAEAVEQLLSWIQQNPPTIGINWHSSLELAMRCISWLWTLFFILPSESLTNSAAQRIGDSLFAQFDHICRHTSLYTSPNTHLIGEAAALFIAGLVFRDRKPAALWLRTGAALLAQETARQFAPDGLDTELSASYHCYAIDFYLQANLLAAHNNYQLSDSIPRTIERALDALVHLTRTDGTLPTFGDDDGGRAIILNMSQRNYHSFTDALCIGAVLFHRGDLKHRCGAFSESALWFLGRDAWSQFDTLPSKSPTETTHFFPNSGLFIQRANDSHLTFDCGGLGMITGGHSHADALSLTLSARGKDILVDPGTYTYNGGPDWRNYFRSTRAHNTVAIDGRDQAEMGGPFRWNSRFSIRAQSIESPTATYIEAEHDGYGDVSHRRRVVPIQEDYWIVLDDFFGAGVHTFELNYHFGPDVSVELFQRGELLSFWLADAGFLFALSASKPLSSRLLHGSTEPIAGWTSDGYGHKLPSPTLRAIVTAPASLRAMTLLRLSPTPLTCNPWTVREILARGAGASACQTRAAHASALSCSGDGFDDLAIFSSADSDITIGAFRLRGEFFWIRTHHGTVVRTVSIGATALQFQGRDLLEDAPCAQFAAL